MTKTKATKKACSDISTELSDDFISRAMRSNPVELLENEALKFDFLFNQKPNPVFKAYHDESLAADAFAIFEKFLAEFAGKQSNQCVTAFCLRKDIGIYRVLTYASSYLKNKSYIKNIVKRHPKLSTWEGIYSVFLDIYNEHAKNEIYSITTYVNIWEVLEFYTRLDPTSGQVYEALKDIMSLVSNNSKSDSKADRLLLISYSSTKRLFKFLIDKDYVTDVIYTLYQTRFNQRAHYRNSEYNMQFYEYMVSKGHSYTESAEKCFVRALDILDRTFKQSPQTLRDDYYYAERVISLKLFNYIKRTNHSLFEEKLGDSLEKLDKLHPWAAGQSLLRKYREKLTRQALAQVPTTK